MKRAVVTGMGLVSPLGNNVVETKQSLINTTSGIKYQSAYEEMGLRSLVAGSIDIDVDGMIERKLRRFMGDAAAFSFISLSEAIANSKLANSSITVTDGSNSTATALGGTITFTAGEGIDVTESSGTITIEAEDATASNK